MKKGKLLLCLVVVILAGSLLSCTKKSPAQEAVSSVETRIYVDAVGRQVELPQQITRIIPAGPLALSVLLSFSGKPRGTVFTGAGFYAGRTEWKISRKNQPVLEHQPQGVEEPQQSV